MPSAVWKKVITENAADWVDLTDAGATTLHKHDHGGQDGLADDDHTQYLLASNLGSRITATANWTDLTDKGLTDLHHHITISASEPAVPYAYQIWIDT